MKKLVLCIALLSSVLATVQASIEEPSNALRSLARFMVWTQETPQGVPDPFSHLRATPAVGSGRDAIEMMRFLERVATRDSARIEEIAKLLRENDKWLGEVPFEDSPNYRRPQDEDVYIYLLFRPGEDTPEAHRRHLMTRSHGACRASSKRNRVAAILETSYGGHKTLHAIGIAIQALSDEEAAAQMSLGDASSMLDILVRHPSSESFRIILQVLSLREGSWVGETNASYLRHGLTHRMSQPNLAPLWLPLLKKNQFMDRQQAHVDRLIQEVEKRIVARLVSGKPRH